MGSRNEPPALLRLLLRLFPRAHRRAYGPEMWEVVRFRWQTRGSGRLAAVSAVVASCADLALSALALRCGRAVEGLGSRPTWLLEAQAAARALKRAPGFASAVVFVLAGAVAANVAVFSFVNGTLLTPPPFEDATGVVVAWGSNPGQGRVRDVISGSNFIDLADRARTVSSLAAIHGDEVMISEDGRPEVAPSLEVTVDFLRTLGVSPLLGRDFGEEDRTSGSGATAIVSHAFWTNRLGGDADAVGTRLMIDGEETTVVGVLPAGFRFLGSPPFLVPLRDDLLAAESRTHHHYHLVGRLVPGTSVSEATAEMSGIMRELAGEDPRLEGWQVLVERFHEASVESVRGTLWLLTTAVLSILGIAIVNLASLIRVRAVGRRDEMAVRRALGAAGAQLGASVVAETAILSAAGVLLGLLGAPLLLRYLSSLVPPTVTIPGSAAAVPALQASLDASVVTLTLLAGVMVGALLVGASLRASLGGAPHAQAITSGRVRRGPRGGWLIGVELALATSLCAASVLSFRSALALAAEDVGLEAQGLLTLYFGDVGSRSVAERNAYFRDVLEAVRQVPGVQRAGLNDYVPFEGEDDFEGFRFPERPVPAPGEGPREEWRRVSEGLFEAAGMRIVRGRGFVASDFQSRPAVVVINRAFGAKHYPGEDPVGRPLTVTEDGYRDLRIVGVVEDVRARGPGLPAPPVFYVPLQGAPRGHMAVYARVSGGPRSVAASVRESVWSVDSSQPVLAPVPMQELVDRTLAIPRLTRDVVGALALMALALAGAGIFGVVGYTVRARRGELGVRLALGATATRLEGELLRTVLPTLVLSLGAGLAVAVAVAEGASRFLYGAGGADPISLVAAGLTMSVVTFVATWLPARGVSRIDPAEALQ